MFLATDIYSPAGTSYQVLPEDLDSHIDWVKDINGRLPKVSNYFIEIGHNGNGNIEVKTIVLIVPSKLTILQDAAANDPNEYCTAAGEVQLLDADYKTLVPLEWVKPLGTGRDLWPHSPDNYTYTTQCSNLDPLRQYWATTSKLNAFAHISHTFTHELEDNATYFDIYNEITWNNAVGFSLYLLKENRLSFDV